MMRFSSLGCRAALVVLLTPIAFAQDAPSANPSVSEASTQNQQQADVVEAPRVKSEYFKLEHRSPDQLEPEDAALVKKSKRQILGEAEFYGYNMSAKDWTYEQSVCPFMPDYVMLRYSSKGAAESESLFTVLVPRNGGRVFIVPVLHNGVARLKPAPVDPRNYQVFSQVIPADVAAKNSGPDGKWMQLSLCYAEMTGSGMQVPNEAALDIYMIKAPPPTLRMAVNGKDHDVRFTDPISPTKFRLWDINYNSAGKITDVNNAVHSYGEPVVTTAPEPTPKLIPPPAVPQPKDVPSSQQANPLPQPKPVPQQPQ